MSLKEVMDYKEWLDSMRIYADAYDKDEKLKEQINKASEMNNRRG